MILCADDFGLRDDITEAVLTLVRRGKLSAVSCMVVLDHCDTNCLSELLAHQSEVDVGLHFCLTDVGLPLEVAASGVVLSPLFPSFRVLLRKALLRQVKARDITPQISNQYALFLKKCGRRPDFIDGHLHVHQLPNIRSGLLDFVSSLPPECRPYIRNTRVSMLNLRSRRLPWLKACLIGFFGAQIWSQLHSRGLPTNEGFAGIYDFKRGSKYHEYLPRFIDCLPQLNSILVVHPGHQEEWRQREFIALSEFSFAPGALNRFQQQPRG